MLFIRVFIVFYDHLFSPHLVFSLRFSVKMYIVVLLLLLCCYDYAIGLLLLECSKMCCELFVCQLLLSYLTSVTCRISVYFVALRCVLTHLTFLLVNDRLSHFNCMLFVFMTVISPIFPSV